MNDMYGVVQSVRDHPALQHPGMLLSKEPPLHVSCFKYNMMPILLQTPRPVTGQSRAREPPSQQGDSLVCEPLADQAPEIKQRRQKT